MFFVLAAVFAALSSVSHAISFFQGSDRAPELADPYVTVLPDLSVILSGTSEHFLRFPRIEDLGSASIPPQIVSQSFFYADGTPMEPGAHSWDLKPFLWPSGLVWYGGHMRPRFPRSVSRWPEDNYSRDIFAFEEKEPGQWVSRADSIFHARKDWPRARGNYLGHRYGHQIVQLPGRKNPAIFYEEVTAVSEQGAPLVTKIFVDEMASPFQVLGRPTELLSPLNPKTNKPYPSALREDGAILVEGPLYFRFRFEGEEREAIGFSAGSYFARYPSCFASRRVADGLKGKPYLLDLNDEGSDLNDAASELGRKLQMTGGPGRPSVIVNPDGAAILDSRNRLQVLVHGYRPGERYRVSLRAQLHVEKHPTARGALRFTVMDLADSAPDAVQRPLLSSRDPMARGIDSARRPASSDDSRLRTVLPRGRDRGARRVGSPLPRSKTQKPQ